MSGCFREDIPGSDPSAPQSQPPAAAVGPAAREADLEAPRHDASALSSMVMRGQTWWLTNKGEDPTHLQKIKIWDYKKREAKRRGEHLYASDVDTFEMRMDNLIQPPGSHQKRKQVCRSKYGHKGRTGGYGRKGAKARGRRRNNPGFEGGNAPIHHRIPRLTQEQLNSMKKDMTTKITLENLNQCNDGDEVDYYELFIRGIPVPFRGTMAQHQKVKIVGEEDDEFTVKDLKVYAHFFMPTAREKIEALGGECIRLHQVTNIPVALEYAKLEEEA